MEGRMYRARFFQELCQVAFRVAFLGVFFFTAGQTSAVSAQQEAAPALAVVPHCGNTGSNESWSGAGTVHLVTCSVTVPGGATLIIAAGAIVKFYSEKSLIGNGKLVAVGTAANPIYFT